MKKIRIIYTGGTIGGKANQNGVIDDDVKSKKFMSLLSQRHPSLMSDINFDEIELSTETPIKEFSENMAPSDWAVIGKSVYKASQDNVDAVVIAHGTDTMVYTAASLTYMLQGIKIPVVLTGSNMPIEAPITDASQNMHDAMKVALDDRFRGVYIVFSGIDGEPSDIHLGCRARKVRFAENCFKSINIDKIGCLSKKRFSSYYSINIINEKLLNKVALLHSGKEFALHDSFVDKVLFLKIYPGFNPDYIDQIIDRKDVKGIILEIYGSGTGCVKGKYSLTSIVEKANSRNFSIPIFITSQQEGRVVMDTYSSSKELISVGAIPLKDMISEAAIPKLMWALGQANSKNDIINIMLTNYCGELDNEHC